MVIVCHDERIRDIADRVLWLEGGAFRDLVVRAEDPVSLPGPGSEGPAGNTSVSRSGP